MLSVKGQGTRQWNCAKPVLVTLHLLHLETASPPRLDSSWISSSTSISLFSLLLLHILWSWKICFYVLWPNANDWLMTWDMLPFETLMHSLALIRLLADTDSCLSVMLWFVGPRIRPESPRFPISIQLLCDWGKGLSTSAFTIHLQKQKHSARAEHLQKQALSFNPQTSKPNQMQKRERKQLSLHCGKH